MSTRLIDQVITVENAPSTGRSDVVDAIVDLLDAGAIVVDYFRASPIVVTTRDQRSTLSWQVRKDPERAPDNSLDRYVLPALAVAIGWGSVLPAPISLPLNGSMQVDGGGWWTLYLTAFGVFAPQKFVHISVVDCLPSLPVPALPDPSV